MADVIAKLKVDAKEYDGGLAKAKKSLDQFTKQNMSLNGIMAQGMTALTKFAGGFAAAELAAKSFNAIIMEGSQVTGDFVRNGVGALNDTLGVLASSIASLDFTALTRGLSDVYKQALAARESLDSLNDTLRGLGLAGSDAREAVAELRAVNADSTSTDEQKAKALQDANAAVKEYKEVVQATITETNNWVDSSIKAMSGMRGVKTSADDVKKAIIDYAKYDSEGKKQIVKNATEIHKQYGELVKAREDLNEKTITFTDEAGVTTTATFMGGTEEQIKLAEAELVKFEKANATALRQYTLFHDMDDQEANTMAQNVANLSEYSRGLARMDKQLSDAQKTMASTTKATGGGKSTAKAAEPIKSSMTFQDFDIPDFPSMLNDSIPSMKSLNELAKQFKDDMLSATTTEQYNAAAQSLEKVQRAMELQPIAIQAGITIDEAAAQASIQEQLNNMDVSIQASLELNQKSMKSASGLSDTGKDAEKSFEAASRAISSAGSALQSVDNEGLNIAGTIMQAIADVALGFAMALASPTAAATGPWGWIAAAAAGAATMVATIATIKSATSGSYAQGGIVPGAYNGGLDSTYVYASPGEVILNRAQQENLLSQLDDGSSSGNVTFVLNGEKLEGCLNHYGRRSGKGKVVFA